MTKQAIQLKVFVASPSDIKDERVIIGEVLDDINKIFSPRFGLEFDLVKWEMDTYPGIGDDAQSVINNQIGDDYDVLVGIFWTRIGTATKRSVSGTVEEIMRAYQRAKEMPDRIQLMVYFRNSPISPDDIDGNQISQVHQFKKKISELGVYWWPYNSIRDFERHIRLHLQNTLLDFRDKLGANIKTEKGVDADSYHIEISNIPNINKFSTADQAEKYILNLGDSVGEALGLAIKSAKKIGESMKLLGIRTGLRADEILKAKSEHNGGKKAFVILNEFSIEVEEFTLQVMSELPVISSSFRSAIDRSTELASIASYVPGYIKIPIEKHIAALTDVKNSDLELINSLKTFRAAQLGLKGRALKLDTSIARLLIAVDNLVEEFETQVSLVTELLKVYENVCGYN
jgi:hypothetical protein